MIAVILAAGKGSRISQITNGIPKSLLPLNDITILGHTLNQLNECNIKEIHIVTGYKQNLIVNYVKAFCKDSVNFINNPIYSKSNVLYSLYLSIPFLKGQDVIFIHADTLFTKNILDTLINKLQDNDAVLPVEFKKCGKEEMKVITKDNNVIKISKNISTSKSEGEFLGIAALSKNLIEMIELKAKELFLEGDLSHFFEAALQELINEKKITVPFYDILKESWIEIDTVEDYKDAINMFKKQ